MKIEVDQSGKIESNKDTVIAFSDGERCSVKIERKLKRELFQDYRKTNKFGFVLRLFAIALFYLLKDRLKNKDSIIIDDEYPKHERLVKDYLLKLIKSADSKFDKNKIKISRIGKNSEAHILAYNTFIGNKKPDKIISKEEILKYL